MYITKNNAINNDKRGIALFNLGFRIFFLGAGVFSVLSISLWSVIYILQLPLSLHAISSFQWHAHEMIYGYSMAVIAGFLLTAVKSWTGVQTLHGKSLIMLFSLWAIARLLFLFGTSYIFIAGVFDILFLLGLIVAVSKPIMQVKQWKQLAILSKLILLGTGNVCFYLGATSILDQGVFWGLYGGLYLIIGLILTIGRRILPFFIERGVGYPVKLFNSIWLDVSSMLLVIVFFVTELFVQNQIVSSYLAVGIFLINAVRLIGWYTPGIWQKSLLWSLYLSFWFICFGFLLFAGIHFVGISRYLAIHAFAYGGIGVVTLAMMSRVALGHTGRDISKAPRAMSYAFGFILSGAVIRVIVPLFSTLNYSFWIGVSQLFWVIAFLIFTIIYFPVLVKPRVDGKPG